MFICHSIVLLIYLLFYFLGKVEKYTRERLDLGTQQKEQDTDFDKI